MKRSLTIGMSLFVLMWTSACTKQATQGTAAALPVPATSEPSNREGAMHAERVVRIEATTVETLGNWTVTVANLMQKDKWQGEDGVPHEGPTAEVGLYDEKERDQGRKTVGEGTVLTIQGTRWTVTKVAPAAGGHNGFIELRAVR